MQAFYGFAGEADRVYKASIPCPHVYKDLIIETEVNAMSERERSERPQRGRRAKRKVCIFCADKVEAIDYKDVAKLRKFLSERAKILPRRITGNCAHHQRQTTVAIKRARQIALLPYSTD